jgi:hypothetical protein
MVKNLARACLRLVTLVVPVFIAACYGVPTQLMRYSATGKVIDKDSDDPIGDILISCLDSSNALQASATSLNGDFTFYYDIACDHLAARDTQRPVRYQEIGSISFVSDTITISMEKVM